jgi:hypothetical protein
VKLVLDGSSQTYLVGEIILNFAHIIVVDAMSILRMFGCSSGCSSVS